MKHPSSRAFYAYWDDQRGSAKAPDRNTFEPGAVRELLGDSFVIAHQPAGGLPFRVAGTRVCALFGRDLKGEALADLVLASDRAALLDLIGLVVDEQLPVIAGISAVARDGAPIQLELLLLPFSPRAHMPPSFTGLLVPLGPACPPLRDLTLTSWRILQPQRPSPRRLRKVAVAHGLTVYEGLR